MTNQQKWIFSSEDLSKMRAICELHTDWISRSGDADNPDRCNIRGFAKWNAIFFLERWH